MAPPPHRFSVGERVTFSGIGPASPAGAFTVLRLLPNDQADREYRVRSVADGQERVARETQLRAAPRGAGADWPSRA